MSLMLGLIYGRDEREKLSLLTLDIFISSLAGGGGGQNEMKGRVARVSPLLP